MQTPFRLQIPGFLALSVVILSSPAVGKGLDLVPMGIVEEAKSVTVDMAAPTPSPALAIPVPTAPAAAEPVSTPAQTVATPASAVVPAPMAVEPAKDAASAAVPSLATAGPLAAPAPASTPAPIAAPDPQLAPAPIAPVEAPEAAEPAEQVWQVPSHGTLREMMESWGERAGWRVVWDTDLDYPLEAGFEVRGDFVKAADAVFAAYWDAKEKFAVRAYSNNVLLVRQMGVNGK